MYSRLGVVPCTRVLEGGAVSSLESPARTRSGHVLTALYGEHAPDAFRYALHLTGRRADAEDVVQQVFLQAHRHLESGGELVSPRAWLLTAVKHKAFNLARDRREVPVDEPARTATAAESGRDEAAQLADVRGMLWTLPEAQHQAFVLRHWSGLSQDEIAQVLETTPTAVESLLVRARSGVLRARSSASDACTQIRRRLLDSTELGPSDEAHLGTCRPCRQAHTRLMRAANIAGTLALVPGTHVADSIAGLVPGFSAHAATSAMAGVGTAGGAGVGAAGGGAGVWGTTTAVTTVSKVAVVAKATAAVVAATVAIGTIPPVHHAMSAVIAGHVPGSSSGSTQAGGRDPHGRRGEHGSPRAPVVAGGDPGVGNGRSLATHPGKHPDAGKGLGKPVGAGSGGKPTGAGGGKGNGQGNGAALGAGGGNAGGNGKGVGKPSGANGAGVGKLAGAGGNGDGNGGGKPAGAGGGKPTGAGGGNGNAGGNGNGGGKPPG